MKEIKLSSGLVTKVDDMDFRKFSRFSWSNLPINGRRGGYVVRNLPRIYTKTNGRYSVKRPHSYLHREIIGAKRGQFVDHIDGDVLNNQRSNLRICSPSQNSINSPPTIRNLSGFKGVSFSKKRNRWLSRIGSKTIGQFASAREAAAAYNAEAIKKYREFAYLNHL